MIHLLSMFSDGLAHVRKRTNTQIAIVQDLAQTVQDQMRSKNIQDQGGVLERTITSENKRQTDRLNKELRLLSPKRQIRRVFPVLFLALIFLTLYNVGKKECWIVNENFFVRNLFFFLSFICAGLGVYFLKNIAWAVIDIKQELATSNNQGKEKSEALSPIEEDKK